MIAGYPVIQSTEIHFASHAKFQVLVSRMGGIVRYQNDKEMSRQIDNYMIFQHKFISH